VKRFLVVLLALGCARVLLPRVRRFADPDPSDYGHPRPRV
jgi:hypothetical protein